MAWLRRVHQLPEPGREVVYLRAFGGLSFREIGDVLGKTETWARVTFYRGKETQNQRQLRRTTRKVMKGAENAVLQLDKMVGDFVEKHME